MGECEGMWSLGEKMGEGKNEFPTERALSFTRDLRFEKAMERGIGDGICRVNENGHEE